MSRGKHLSLHEARKSGQLDTFAKEHPATGDADAFEKVLKAMASGKKPKAKGTSTPAASANSSGTRSRRVRSEGNGDDAWEWSCARESWLSRHPMKPTEAKEET